LPYNFTIKSFYDIIGDNPPFLEWLKERTVTPPKVTRNLWRVASEFDDCGSCETVLKPITPDMNNWQGIWNMIASGYYEREYYVKGDEWEFSSKIRYLSNDNEIDITTHDSWIVIYDDSMAVEFKLTHNV
jgi:hypothetical protein